MARTLIVIGEALAVMADLEDAAVEADPRERRRIAPADAGVGLAVSGLERLGGEQAQNVGEQKLLMLLLVIDAELDQLRRLRAERGVAQPLERRIDEVAVVAHLLRRGPGQQPALGARLPRADALVIGVEAIFEALVEHAVAGEKALQQERLEEPGGMREMPLGRARIVHRLDDLVLVAQRRGKLARQAARLEQPVAQGRFGRWLGRGEDGVVQVHVSSLGSGLSHRKSPDLPSRRAATTETRDLAACSGRRNG